jgi:hypothetical protein
MPFGRCGLCREDRDLRRSHLLPAGVFAIFRSCTTAGEHPVLITPRGSVFSDHEARAYLLCDDCEARFNREGEDWTLENCWRGPTEFRLRNVLGGAASVEREPGYHVFDGAATTGVEMRKLVYFAASVFWRAAACRWRIGEQLGPRLPLGPYEESLRQFLLAESAALPDGVALVIGVSVAREDGHNCVAEYPIPNRRSSGHFTHRFSIPGLSFMLFVGRPMPPVAKSYCASRTGT